MNIGELRMRICGIGCELPGAPKPSAFFDAMLGLSPGEVQRMSGVSTRHVCDGDATQISMGVAAARMAMVEAGIGPGDVDLVISASAVGYQPIPATAPRYQGELGIADGAAFAFDVNSTCLSFVTALDICAGWLDTGRYKCALIISSELASRALPWQNHPETAGLFGDGAAAVVVRPGDSRISTLFRTYPSAFESCSIGAGGTRYDFHGDNEAFAAHAFFEMNGKDLFRVTAQHFKPFVDELLAHVGWDRDDVDLIVPHQASPRALCRMTRQCGFDPVKVVNISERVANQVAASIPVALHYAKDRLVEGTKLLILGTSAGVSFGGAAVTI